MIKGTMIIATFLVLVSTAVFANKSDGITVRSGFESSKPSTEEVKEPETCPDVSLYERKIEELETKVFSLYQIIDDISASKINKRKHNSGILIPDARYEGKGKYCYPEATDKINEFAWKCDS